MKFFNWGLDGILPGSYEKSLRAARRKQQREALEFYVKIATPILTVTTLIVAVYQASLATKTSNSLIYGSLRQQIAIDRVDRDRLKELSSEITSDLDRLDASSWLSDSASESQFRRGREEALRDTRNTKEKIDTMKNNIANPYLWQLLTLYEDSFFADLEYEITYSSIQDDIELQSKKRILREVILTGSHQFRDALNSAQQSADSKLSNEIGELGQQ